ncbi:MAG: primary replicative helicase [Firmicutes bacterium]|nr:primary replicative helicase [Bacillota bacterium]
MIDFETEKQILACMIQDKECLESGVYDVNPDHFSQKFCKDVFYKIKEMYEANMTVNPVTVATELRDIVHANGTTWLLVKDAKQLAHRMLETIGLRLGKKTNGGICTRFAKLNKIINGGVLPGQLLMVGAKTGEGKTAFAMNLNHDIAVKQKIPSLYVNTEMSDKQIDFRNSAILCAKTKFTHSDFATGNMTQEEYDGLPVMFERMYQSGFHTTTQPNLNINKLISIARKFKSKTGMKFMVVDYVGRMDTTDSKLSEWQVLKNIAKKLKTLAQQLEITILMLVQINDDDKVKGAKDMKDECDLFAHLRQMTPEELAENPGFNYFLAVEKNRDGMTGLIKLKFIGEKMYFIGEDEDAKLAERQHEPGTNTQTTGSTGESTYGGNYRQGKQRKMPFEKEARGNSQVNSVNMDSLMLDGQNSIAVRVMILPM